MKSKFSALQLCIHYMFFFISVPTHFLKEKALVLFSLHFTSKSIPCSCISLFIAYFPPASKQQTPTISHEIAWLHISSYMHFPEENSPSLSLACDRVGELSAFKVGNILNLFYLFDGTNKLKNSYQFYIYQVNQMPSALLKSFKAFYFVKGCMDIKK